MPTRPPVERWRRYVLEEGNEVAVQVKRRQELHIMGTCPWTEQRVTSTLVRDDSPISSAADATTTERRRGMRVCWTA